MKILIHSDNHWSESSSIVKQYGLKYTKRLELLIMSMNWLMQKAIDLNCVATICCGDFFNAATLKQAEITALSEIKWAENIPHYFLVGNHESEEIDLHYNSTKALEASNRFIISEPTEISFGNTQIHFLPYITDTVQKPILDYINNSDPAKHQVLISHNDIAGINYGLIKSTTGFPLADLEENFDLVLNGHIHNSSWVAKNVLNVGSFTAHNFTNDSDCYQYGIWIFDTDTLELEFIENPYALNFYQFSVESEADLDKLTALKEHAVISVHCKSMLVPALRSKIDEIQLKNPNAIIEKRILTMMELGEEESAELDVSDLSIDYLQELCNYCRTKLDNTAVLDWVLAEICK